MFGSITVEVGAPKVASIHRSLIWAIGSGLVAEADSGAATKALFGGRVTFTNQGDIHIALDTTYFNLRKLVNIFTDSQHLARNANTHY